MRPAAAGKPRNYPPRSCVASSAPSSPPPRLVLVHFTQPSPPRFEKTPRHLHAPLSFSLSLSHSPRGVPGKGGATLTAATQLDLHSLSRLNNRAGGKHAYDSAVLVHPLHLFIGQGWLRRRRAAEASVRSVSCWCSPVVVSLSAIVFGCFVLVFCLVVRANR